MLFLVNIEIKMYFPPNRNWLIVEYSYYKILCNEKMNNIKLICNKMEYYQCNSKKIKLQKYIFRIILA